MEGPRHHKRIRPVASTTRTDLMRGSDRSDWLEVAAIEGNMPTALWVSLLSPILLLAYVAVVKAMGLTERGRRGGRIHQRSPWDLLRVTAAVRCHLRPLERAWFDHAAVFNLLPPHSPRPGHW